MCRTHIVVDYAQQTSRTGSFPDSLQDLANSSAGYIHICTESLCKQIIMIVMGSTLLTRLEPMYMHIDMVQSFDLIE